MKISRLARREAKQLFRTCVVNGVLDESRVRQAVGKVVELKPRGYFGILSHFQRLVRLELERRTARVESATALSPDLEADVKTRLTGIYGNGLAFAFSQNPELIGGLRIKVGSDVYDGSVQARLERVMDGF